MNDIVIRSAFPAARPSRRAALGLLSSAAAACAIPRAHAAPAPRTVVELFTSQGCSSCPPADALLGQLARDPSILALSWPVDYWDYIGWKDTFASPAFTARQRAYAGARNDSNVYTPQAVIDGLYHAVGSDRGEIDAAARKASGQPGVLSVPLALTQETDRLVVSVAASAATPPAGLWLICTTSHPTVAIGRGENGGATVTYTNVVRSMTRMGEWTGAALQASVPLAQIRAAGCDGYAVLLQTGTQGRPGAILGAAQSA